MKLFSIRVRVKFGKYEKMIKENYIIMIKEGHPHVFKNDD